ncbi:hypothetical protein SAY87_004872 [Trapa incisa]|uniref:Uncharacterized protein n=1 Tax=Trapa incisa TaxID=236973 RepID=A0AAN7JQ01_9MYRT|nr:hypothetical protein SAY87_004872 [Trapa incisa]
MFNEGHKHLSGLQDAVIKNIHVCKQLSIITRASLDPNGTLGFLLNDIHLLLLFILVLVGKAQHEEISDCANLTISFDGGGELVPAVLDSDSDPAGLESGSGSYCPGLNPVAPGFGTKLGFGSHDTQVQICNTRVRISRCLGSGPEL